MKSSGRRWTPLAVAALVLGFIVWWPLGLAVLAYILWGGDVDTTVKHTVDQFRTPSSGNAAFDDYKKETIDRLEKEQAAFAEFVEHLRRSRDREEFERFMAERNKPTQAEAA